MFYFPCLYTCILTSVKEQTLKIKNVIDILNDMSYVRIFLSTRKNTQFSTSLEKKKVGGLGCIYGGGDVVEWIDRVDVWVDVNGGGFGP